MAIPSFLLPQHSRGGHSSRSHPSSSSDHRGHYNYHHRGASVRNAPHPHMHHQLHPSHAPPTTILPHLLSWQTSQSFNTYPWRVQNNVPFFTFPSTPPQYLPANSYPYTFAPLPVAPFPMQPVVTHALPIPMTNEHVPVAVTLGNPNPSAVVSVNVIQQPVIHGPTHDSVPNQDLAIIHGLGPSHPHFQTVAPMPLVQTERGVIQNGPPMAVPHTPHVISLEQSNMNIGMAVNQPPMDMNAADSAVRMWVQGGDSRPGPSHHQQSISHSDSSDSISSSPRDSLSPIFYTDSDTLDTPPMINSPQVMFQGISQGDSSASSSDSPLLSTATLGLTDSPSSEAGPSVANSSSEEPLRLPVLINISDSELDSNATTPSVIDLTSSPSMHLTHNMPSTPSVANDNGALPVLVPVIHEREASSRRILAFNQDETTAQYVEPPSMAVPSGSILATAPPTILRGGVLSGPPHPSSHPLMATMAPPNTLPPGLAAIRTGNVQVLGWQPTFEAPPTQSHPQPPPEVPVGGHLNILVPPNVVPAQPFPSAMIPHHPPRGEFWETVMVCAFVCLFV